MDEAFLLGLLPKLAQGVTEIYCHPATFPARVPDWPSHYRPLDEFYALTSPKVAEVLQHQNLELISFDDLVKIIHYG